MKGGVKMKFELLYYLIASVVLIMIANAVIIKIGFRTKLFRLMATVVTIVISLFGVSLVEDAVFYKFYANKESYGYEIKTLQNILIGKNYVDDDIGDFDKVDVKLDKISPGKYIANMTHVTDMYTMSLTENTSSITVDGKDLELVDGSVDDNIGFKVGVKQDNELYVKYQGIYIIVSNTTNFDADNKYKLTFAKDSVETNGKVQTIRKARIKREG